jgi:acetolactate synthase-1/2/3 large subunit
VDIEPRGAASKHRPDVILAADAAAFLRVAQRVLARAAFDATSLDERTAANTADREAFEAGSIVDAEAWDGPGVHPGRVVATLARMLPRDAILTTDAGDFGTWAARGFHFHRPGTFLGSAAGPLGYGLPAAIGAALARPGRLGVALAGDGGFAMTMADMETAVRERAHVVAVVFDNNRYGTIWRHQADRGSAAGLGIDLGAVDFAAVAEACGALGISVGSDEEFEPAMQQALDAGRPALLHLALDPRWTTPDGSWDLAEVDSGESAVEAASEALQTAVEAIEAEVEAELEEAMVDAVEAVEALKAVQPAIESTDAQVEVADPMETVVEAPEPTAG